MSTIGDTVNTTVYLGSASYPDPLTVNGVIQPLQGGYSPGVLGVAPGVSLTNQGSIFGGAGSATYRGSVAVRFSQSGGSIVNAQGALIQGGAGYASTTTTGIGFGGDAVEIDDGQTLTNAGTLIGGNSYHTAAAQYPLGGGEGVRAGFSTIQNAGSAGHVATITGGYGFGGAYGGNGVDLSGGSVTNASYAQISGGGAQNQFGGFGARLTQEATLTNQAGGVIQGGEGHFTTNADPAASLYGAGVIAFSPAPGDQLAGPRTYTVTNDGTLHGGDNSASGSVDGSVGASLWDGASLDNVGIVTGGGGNAAGSDNHQAGTGMGGDGVELVWYGTLNSGDRSPSRLNNSGTIQGGEGALRGGLGLNAQGGTVAINSGTIQGGSADNGAGGIGAFLYGGTLTNSGHVIGGSGQGDYSGIGIDFESGSTLMNLSSGTIKGGDTTSRYNSAGTGMEVDRGPSPSLGSVTNDGTISGGDTQAGSYSAGGVGVVLYDGKVDFTNAGIIKGGSALGVDPATDIGLSGGLGVYLRSGLGAALENDGRIYGGNAQGNGSSGGRGAILGSGSSLDNTGSITGGTATTSNPDGGTVGGVGVYLSGGALTTSGAITGGSGVQNAAAVEFGFGSSTLTIEAGASFGGAIAGFRTGDTIYIANLTTTDFYQDFNYSTDTLTTANYGTLHFNGLFLPGEFDPQNFSHTSGTGPASGLEITLRPEDIIDRYVTQTVELGSSSYSSPVIITTTGAIQPGVGVALQSSTSGVAVYNQGNIDGGAALATAASGAGVDFSAPGTVMNLSSGRIRGGNGYHSAAAGPDFGHGADGVSLQGGTLVNASRIYGGTGYSDVHDSTDAGGAGVYVAGGSLTNAGTALYNAAIYGGAGDGMSDSSAALVMVGGTADNGAFATLTGGFADAGAVGAGAQLSAGAKLTNEIGGTINGGERFNTSFIGAMYPPGAGVLANDSTLTNHGTINGGESWVGGSTVAGAGVDLEAGSTASNDGTINGGTGGAATVATASGRGGDGVEVGANSQLNNSGTILGGLGSAQGGGKEYGGSGVAGGASASILNSGTITGGQTDETPGFAAAYAGAGVTLDGGALTNSGTVQGSILFVPLATTAANPYAGDGVDATGATVTNSASSGVALIAGGDGWNGGVAGIGLKLDGGGGTNGTNGLIRGGEGISNYVTQGGVGLVLGDSATFTNSAGGELEGGAGNSQFGVATGGVGVYLKLGSTLTNASGGLIEGGSAVSTVGTADAGTAATVGTNATLNNSGAILGGTNTNSVTTGNSGGGAGAILDTGGTLNNLAGATLYGGAAQADNGIATAGVGVQLDGGTLNNLGTIRGGAGNSVGGVGVYLYGGTLIDSGSIGGGSGTAAGAAVQFGAAHGVLVLDSGAAINGDIAGFHYGDTIDLSNVTLDASDFDQSSGKLTTGMAYGTLQFSGYFLPGQMQFNSDGGNGTEITLLSESAITTAITHNVIINTGNYFNPLTITATGSVKPGAETGLDPQRSTEWAVYGDNAADTLTNAGVIVGGNTSVEFTANGLNKYFPQAEAAGVYFKAGGSITNTGSITGGYVVPNGYLQGGYQPMHRMGGVGVLLDGGTLSNSGSISGAYGNGPISIALPGVLRGGDGVDATDASVDNTSTSGTAQILGGNGYFGARGGDGLVLNGGSGSNGSDGLIAGGMGTNAPPPYYTGRPASFGREGGGAGVTLLFDATFTNQAGGRINGGGAYAFGQATYAGVGVYLAGTASLDNQGSITGGNSDRAGSAGVEMTAANIVTNTGTITGGTGHYGGSGVQLLAGSLTNSGTITGGQGGGVGVDLEGGTLTDSGSIRGADGAADVSFGTSATLVLQTGASITGVIAGFRYGDTIDLSNVTLTADDFDQGTDRLNTGTAYGMLQFSGYFLPGQMQFNSDGGNGTDITLLHENGINAAIGHSVTLDTPGYLSPLTISANGSVEGNAGGGLSALKSTQAAIYGDSATDRLTNAGKVIGGHASIALTAAVFNTDVPEPEAAGVYFDTGGSITNSGSISGGYIGLTGDTSPGYATPHRMGGVGVLLDGGTLSNSGTLSGGFGEGPLSPNSGGIIRGGDGVYTTGGVVDNSTSIGTARIVGGAGYYGARGGDGLVLNGGTGTNGANGRIEGGTGTDGGIYYPGYTAPPVVGREGGGAGVRMLADSSFTNEAGGQIKGGAAYAYGQSTYSGAGVYLAGTSTFTNLGSISGGSSDLSGGVGVEVTATASAINTGSITGGSAPIGGVGVLMVAGSLTNSGTITGGTGSAGDGAGVELQGGILTDSGSISGPSGAAVTFAGVGTLVLTTGALISGDISGFGYGDTIDLSNVILTASDFDQSTDRLDTGSAYGTLQFTGYFLPGQMQFNSDGGTGTDVTVLHESGIGSTVTHTVILGAGAYLSPLEVTASGKVHPAYSTQEYFFGYVGEFTAVYSNTAGAQLTNAGDIYGGTGSFRAPDYNHAPAAESAGVYLRAGGTVTNSGTILGGYFGFREQSLQTSSGGTGVVLLGGTLHNTGSISGNAGYGSVSVYGAVTGGDGARVTGGTVVNTGSISGGNGGTGAAAGRGLTLDDSTAANNSGGDITGGSSSTGVGGAGVYLNGGMLTDAGTISGGTGTTSGAAVQFGSSAGTLVLQTGASLIGGIAGFQYGDTIDLANVTLDQSDFNSATGTLSTGSAYGTLHFSGEFAPGQLQFGAYGANGTALTLLPETIISTAVGSAVSVTTDTYITTGGSVQPPDNTGASGVYLDGATLTTAGSISGSHGATGFANAVTLGPDASTLVVEPGAVFNGTVAGNGTNDTLKVGGAIDPTLSGFGTQFTGFSTLEFGIGAQWKVEATAASLTEPGFKITGFAPGDTLDVTDLAFVPGAAASFDSGSEQLTVTDGGAMLTLQFDRPFTGDHFSVTQDGSGFDLTVAAAACYRRGTRIRTPAGETPIESLRIGDRVMTASGVARPIRWIGRRSYSRSQALGNRDLLPVRIRAGALGRGIGHEHVPLRDLWVSPEHAMWLEGMLIPARALLNGETIIQETDVEVNYVHIELDSHDVILAEGALSESFVDDDSREHFDNWPEYRRLYPGAVRESARFCGPRVEDGEALEALRQRLKPPELARLASQAASSLIGGYFA